MSQLLLLFLSLTLIVSNTSPALSTSQNNELPDCVVITHCVRENWESKDVHDLFKKAVLAISKSSRTKIVEKTNSYLHAEATTKWRHYTDDLLVLALPEKGYIQVRSESRVGIGDNGVNKKRLDDLAYRLMTNQ